MSLLCQWFACADVATCRRSVIFRESGRYAIVDVCDQHRRLLERLGDQIVMPADQDAA